MKKILSLLALTGLGFAAQAQTSGVPAIDTVVDNATVTVQSPSKYFAGQDGTWTCGVVVNKLSGTAAGKAYLKVRTTSDANWQTIDSATITDVASQYKNWFVTGKKIKDAQVSFGGGTTMSLQVKTYFIKN